MTLTAGSRVGPLEIQSLLGAGGMGEVYRARDTRLNRDVAIKVLPGDLAADATRLARFTREAQTLAALNHPNIAHIHGLEESGDVRALVMELVEGDELSAHIARGPLPLAEALAIARQIADALEAAHDQGIVHRDLKPANIKVRGDGTVSVGFSPGRLFIFDLGRGSLSVIATGTFPSRAIWSKDGNVLIYASSREARAWNLWSRRADGAGDERRYSTSEELQLPAAMSPDGTTLVYSQGSGPSGNFFKMLLADPSRVTPLFTTRTWGLGASFSPDGRYLAFEAMESGREGIYVRPFPAGDQRVQVSTDGGIAPIWTKNGEILFVSGNAIVATSITTNGGSPTASRPTVLFQTGGATRLAPVFEVTPDGKTLFMLRLRGRQQVSVILNFPRDLAQIETAGGGSAPR